MSEAAEKSLLPAGLRTDWPVPRQPVHGTRDGLGARLEYWAARGALSGIEALPRPVREGLIGTLARLARRIDRSRSDAARDFLRTALGDLDSSVLEAHVLEAWRHFLRVALISEGLERHVDIQDIREHFTLDIAPEILELFASRRGCIAVTGHIGDWETGSAILPWLGCDPLYAISKPPRNLPLSVHVQRTREARGIRLLPRRGAMQHAAAVIRSGGTLAMVLDQRARTRPVFAPFFGRMARCDRSAGVLLRRLRAPVVIGACWIEGPWRWHARAHDLIEPKDIAGMSPEEIATRINACFERLILARPDQYFWLHDRYRGADEVTRAREADDKAVATDGPDGSDRTDGTDPGRSAS
jgi:lauroyl/myristoyl acyltransferase